MVSGAAGGRVMGRPLVQDPGECVVGGESP